MRPALPESLKAALALRDKVLPPSLHCEHPSPDIDFAHSPLYVNTELKPWRASADGVRRVGVSAFGFGGTNFHVVMEEHIPGRLNGNGKRSVAVPANIPSAVTQPSDQCRPTSPSNRLLSAIAQSAVAWRAGDRRRLGRRTARASARRAEGGAGRKRPGAGRARRVGSARAGTSGD